MLPENFSGSIARMLPEVVAASGNSSLFLAVLPECYQKLLQLVAIFHLSQNLVSGNKNVLLQCCRNIAAILLQQFYFGKGCHKTREI